MNHDYSLVNIIKDDPDFSKRLAKKLAEIKNDKINLHKTAGAYTSTYRDEIDAGTEKKKKLLSEGAENGLTEEDVMREFGGFLPTRQTPILNLLHFLLRESEEIDRSLYQVRDLANKKIVEFEPDNILSENVKSPDDMFTYLYGHITLDTFNKLKKLKSLTKSPVEEEAMLAFQKCRELCQKYKIDYDKIPVYN